MKFCVVQICIKYIIIQQIKNRHHTTDMIKDSQLYKRKTFTRVLFTTCIGKDTYQIQYIDISVSYVSQVTLF